VGCEGWLGVIKRTVYLEKERSQFMGFGVFWDA